MKRTSRWGAAFCGARRQHSLVAVFYIFTDLTSNFSWLARNLFVSSLRGRAVVKSVASETFPARATGSRLCPMISLKKMLKKKQRLICIKFA